MDLRVRPDVETVEAPVTVRRQLGLGAALFMAYALTSFLMDPSGHYITDVGGKAISVEAMTQRGDWNPDIGYWLEADDPDGRFFPFDKTTLSANGKWVNSTSLTMLYLARPLWALGGPQAALVIPMLGSVAAALAAGALERRLRSGSTGATSTLVVGLGTPAFVYALDFWEHSLGLGLMAVGLVAVFDASTDERLWRRALLAGFCFGLAATMRQEALVYGFVAGLTLIVSAWRHWGRPQASARGLAMAASAGLILGLYGAAEWWVLGGSLRRELAASAAQGESSNWVQLRAAFVTTLGPFNGNSLLGYVVGLALLGSVVWLTIVMINHSDKGPAIRFGAVAWGTYLLMLVATGPAFVPGLVPTTPLAAIGAVAAWKQRCWLPLALGLAPLPLVLFTGYPAGAFIQWGGRYQLLTGLVLTVLAISLLADSLPRLVLAGGAAAIFVSGLGIANGINRTQSLAAEWNRIAAASEVSEVVIWRDSVHAREAGAFAFGQRWLSTARETDRQIAAEILLERQIESFIWIDETQGDLERFDGYRARQSLGNIEFFELRMTRYVAE